MKKVFYYCVVMFTFAVGMMSCSETMGLYEDEGFGMKVAQRQFPVDYDQLANDLDSLGLLYGRDVIVYGVPDIEYQSVLKQTANVMRSISDKEVGNVFVLMTDDEIVKDSLSGLKGINPGSNENIPDGSHVFLKTDYSFLLDNVTVSWGNNGTFVSMPEGYATTLRNLNVVVNTDYLRISGELSVYDEPFSSDTISADTLAILGVYGFSGMTHDEHSWEIHPFASPYPTPDD